MPQKVDLVTTYHTIAKTGTIPEGEGRAFHVEGLMIAVFLKEGQYPAINDFCPHQGAPLSTGYVDEQGAVTCPWHAWRFCIKEGTWLDNPKSKLQVPVYPVRIEGDEIQVGLDLEKDEISPSSE